MGQFWEFEVTERIEALRVSARIGEILFGHYIAFVSGESQGDLS